MILRGLKPSEMYICFCKETYAAHTGQNSHDSRGFYGAVSGPVLHSRYPKINDVGNFLSTSQ